MALRSPATWLAGCATERDNILLSTERVRVELPNQAVLCTYALHYLGSRKATAVTTLAYAKGLTTKVARSYTPKYGRNGA